MSGLQLYRNLHWRYKTYECFANNCNRRYKWPQDLLRHIKVHLKVKFCCELCDYTTHESRLLHVNINKSMWITKDSSAGVIATMHLNMQCKGIDTRRNVTKQTYRKKKSTVKWHNREVTSHFKTHSSYSKFNILREYVSKVDGMAKR